MICIKKLTLVAIMLIGSTVLAGEIPPPPPVIPKLNIKNLTGSAVTWASTSANNCENPLPANKSCSVDTNVNSGTIVFTIANTVDQCHVSFVLNKNEVQGYDDSGVIHCAVDNGTIILEMEGFTSY